MITTMSRPMIAISRVSRTRRHKGCRGQDIVAPELERAPGAVTLKPWIFVLACELPRTEEGENSVEHDRADDQNANDARCQKSGIPRTGGRG